MAHYDDVVGMLGVNLASFLELCKKFLVEWKIDVKPLLNFFNQIREKDLKGLIDGTSGIVSRESVDNIAIFFSEHFECIFESGTITIPDIDKVIKGAKLRWNSAHDTDMLRVQSSPNMTRFEAGMKKMVKIFLIKNGTRSKDCVEFIKNQKGSILPNILGISILDMVLGDVIPENKRILGFDRSGNLGTNATTDYHYVPSLCKTKKGITYDGYKDTHSWSHNDEDQPFCLVVFCDPPQETSETPEIALSPEPKFRKKKAQVKSWKLEPEDWDRLIQFFIDNNSPFQFLAEHYQKMGNKPISLRELKNLGFIGSDHLPGFPTTVNNTFHKFGGKFRFKSTNHGGMANDHSYCFVTIV